MVELETAVLQAAILKGSEEKLFVLLQTVEYMVIVCSDVKMRDFWIPR